MPSSSTSLARLRKRLSSLPFNSHLGIRLKAIHDDGVTVQCPIRPEFGNMHQTLHGGVIATLVDVAAGFGSMAHYNQPVTTVEMKVSFFVPVTGRKVSARSRILRAGRTLCVTQVEVHNDAGKLAAAAMVTYMVLPQAAPKNTGVR